MKKIVRIVAILSLLFIISSFPIGAFAQSDIKAKIKALKPKDYPTDPIEFVVSYPAGGGMDVTARVLAKYVEKYIDHRIVVINKSGASGFIGNTYLATQARNDGYTVGILAAILQDDLLRAKGKWSYKNLEAVAFINDDPDTWIVTTDGAFKDKSLKEVIELAKQKPDTIRVAVLSDISPDFLVDHVEMISGAKFTKVPFLGGAPAITAVLGGHIEIAGFYYPEYKGYLESGRVRVLGVARTGRSAYFPNTPTFDEVLGVKEIVWSAWRYASVPRGTPPERIRYLEAAILAALQDPECIKEYDNFGVKVDPKTMGARQTENELERQYKFTKEFFIKTGRIPK